MASSIASKKVLEQYCREEESLTDKALILKLPFRKPRGVAYSSFESLWKELRPVTFHLSLAFLTRISLSGYTPSKNDNSLIKRSNLKSLKSFSLDTFHYGVRNFSLQRAYIELLALFICPKVDCSYHYYDIFDDIETVSIRDTSSDLLIEFEKLLLLNKKSSYYFVPRLFSKELSEIYGLKHFNNYCRYSRWLTDVQRLDLYKPLNQFWKDFLKNRRFIDKLFEIEIYNNIAQQ